MPTGSGVWTVYRFYATDGALLYVGCSGAILARLYSHECATWWWKEVASTTQVHYSDKASALAAEATAIRDEAPRYNRQLVQKRRLPQVAPRKLFRTWRHSSELNCGFWRCGHCGNAPMQTQPSGFHEAEQLLRDYVDTYIARVADWPTEVPA